MGGRANTQKCNKHKPQPRPCPTVKTPGSLSIVDHPFPAILLSHLHAHTRQMTQLENCDYNEV